MFTIKKSLSILAMVVMMIATTVSFAQDDSSTASNPDGSFGAMASTVTGQMSAFATLLVAIAYVAGIAFVIVALFKFKQHKDNPTQVPIGTPAMLLFIGIFLIYLPSLIQGGGSTAGLSEAGSAAGTADVTTAASS